MVEKTINIEEAKFSAPKELNGSRRFWQIAFWVLLSTVAIMFFSRPWLDWQYQVWGWQVSWVAYHSSIVFLAACFGAFVGLGRFKYR